ncbi:hypothetical protein [Flavobacterium sp. WG21]|uniref:hypothetical protein n=1 Tax=Flavobacterium sp. WG21 TaxID=1229487 RepID=UPI0012F90409|nr:hypothetical protein [Flavobacterium sp. WG21]
MKPFMTYKNIFQTLKIACLFLTVFGMQLLNGQTTYKYKVKWDLRKSPSTSRNVYFYLNTGDTYPFNGTYANASSTGSSSSFSYVLKNSGASPMDGVVVSNTPLRLSGAVDNVSSGFFQKHAPFMTGPYSGYWQSNFAYNFDNVTVTHNTQFEFFYLQTLVEANNYNVSNSELKQCETFNFTVAVVGESGFMTFAVEYYDPNTAGWKELLPYASRSAQNIPITFTSIPNLQLNQNFQLRARYTRTGSGGANDYSDILTYKFIPCSPKLNGAPVTAQVKCFDEPTGNVTLNFLSDIPTGQKLLLTLYQNGAYRSHKFAKDTDVKNRAYTWEGIAPGSYTIKYQTQNASDPNATIGSSPVETPVFKIENAVALTFKATAIQPQCSTDKGGIEISVSGGTPPYYYILDNETKKELVKNPDIIDITTDGDHKVIVLDRFDCMEK